VRFVNDEEKTALAGDGGRGALAGRVHRAAPKASSSSTRWRRRIRWGGGSGRGSRGWL